MRLTSTVRFGTLSLLAGLITQTASADRLDRIFRPVAFEELVAPANEAQESELPPPPEVVPPAADDESVLEAPELSDQLPLSPYDAAPYEAERPFNWPSADSPQDGSLWPLQSQPAPHHQHGHGGHDHIDTYGAFGFDGHEAPGDRVCCEEPRIKYWNHPLLAKETCGCHNTRETTFLLTVPTDCCSVEVPVCVNACCDTVPEFESSRDLLGRKTYTFCWPCGQRVKIVNRHTGTLVVHTYRRE